MAVRICWEKALLISVTVLMLVSVSGAADSVDQAVLKGDLESLSVGDRVRATATIVNPLPRDDTIILNLGLRAPQNIILFNPDPDVAVSCTTPDTLRPDHRCFVDVPAESQKDVNITIEAITNGQGVLTGSVNSSISNLGSSDTLDVQVGPKYGGTLFSAPGIEFVHVLVLGLLAGIMVLIGTPASKD